MTDNEPPRKPRILLVCRNLEGASRICAQLALAGWSTIEAVDTMEALSAVRSLEIDLVLLHLAIRCRDLLLQCRGECRRNRLRACRARPLAE